jgi:hypothetical protein
VHQERPKNRDEWPNLHEVEMSNEKEPATPMLPVEDGWDSVEAMLTASEVAAMDERARCESIVLGELDTGRMRGVPETAGVMVILHRIAGAIRNG